jgi:hypothetical protein
MQKSAVINSIEKLVAVTTFIGNCTNTIGISPTGIVVFRVRERNILLKLSHALVKGWTSSSKLGRDALFITAGSAHNTLKDGKHWTSSVQTKVNVGHISGKLFK